MGVSEGTPNLVLGFLVAFIRFLQLGETAISFFNASSFRRRNALLTEAISDRMHLFLGASYFPWLKGPTMSTLIACVAIISRCGDFPIVIRWDLS